MSRASLFTLTAFALALATALGGACGDSHPPPPSASTSASSSSGGVGGDAFDAGIPDGPVPCPDATGLCACEEVDVIQNIPNLYFVLDTSGSMNAPVDASSTRYDLVREAAVDMVRKLGHLVRVGAATFPHIDGNLGECSAGGEVFPTQLGDPPSLGEGPVTKAFRDAITYQPVGGTPTAATLNALVTQLGALEGTTYVLLATDGGPNCNLDDPCAIDACMPNIDAFPGCGPNLNCCDPANGGTWGNCLDAPAAIGATQLLAEAGILSYVIGIPGSEAYEPTLIAMAQAGNAPPPPGSDVPYYDASDLYALDDVFAEIASLAISCEFDLGGAPPDPSLVNVYLDGELLSYEPLDHWAFKDDHTVELRGATCTRLKTGSIGKVQIVAGCPTEGPK